MNLKVYNQSNTSASGHNSTPLLSINRSGNITFNKAMVEQLKLKAGMGLLFLQDEDNPQDWYIQITGDKEAFPLRTKDKSTSMMIQRAGLAKAILDCRKPPIPYKYAKYRIKPEPIEENGMELWLIFTKPVKSK